MNVVLDAWTLAMVVAATLCLCAAGALWLREHELVTPRVISPLWRKPLAELAVITVIVGGFVQSGATKVNGELRMENVELRHVGAVSELQDQSAFAECRRIRLHSLFLR